MSRSTAETSGLLTLSAIATGIAALVGSIFAVIVALPLSLLAVIIFPVFLGGVLLAAVLAAPVTFGLFPLSYLLVRGRPVVAQLAMPAIGLVGGGAVVSMWFALGVLPHAPNSLEVFTAIGMISGLTAGAFYGRGLYA